MPGITGLTDGVSGVTTFDGDVLHAVLPGIDILVCTKPDIVYIYYIICASVPTGTATYCCPI